MQRPQGIEIIELEEQGVQWSAKCHRCWCEGQSQGKKCWASPTHTTGPATVSLCSYSMVLRGEFTYFHERLRVLLYDLTLYKQNPHSIMDAPEHTSEFESHSGPFNDPINRQMVPANSSQQLPDPPGFSCGAAATFLSRLSCTQTCKGEAGATAVSWAANLFFFGVHSLDSPFESFGNYRNM